MKILPGTFSFLGFLNFNLFQNNPDYAARHLILDEKTNENHFHDFELNFVELPKFTKTLEEGKKIGKRGREVEIAWELKKNGVNIDIIVASTGLTKSEIEKL